MGDGTDGPPGNFSDILGAFSTQADAMVTAAKEGRFAVSEEMGNAYKAALRSYLDDWSTNKTDFAHLAILPELGTGPYATEVGQHAVLVAEGDDQSARAQLESLKVIVERAEEAINTAMSRYRSQDAANAVDIRATEQD
ncbi:hypothetical protein [Amycolatopsis sp. lyj-112]|uniref:hypothetical protein n=1 Tax=Amycolatopsis sp. lyj-112 TaxID=2789288 RepID=UPI003979852E